MNEKINRLKINNNFTQKNLLIAATSFLSIFLLLISLNIFILMQNGKLLEPVSVAVNTGKSDVFPINVYYVSLQNKIYPLKDRKNKWAADNSFIKKIIITLPENKVKDINNIEVNIGKSRFFFNKKTIFEKWQRKRVDLKQLNIKDNNSFILEAPYFVRLSESRTAKFLSVINFTQDGEIFMRNIFQGLIILVLFILFHLVLKIFLLPYFSKYYELLFSNYSIFFIFLILTVSFIISGYVPIHDAINWHGIFHYFCVSIEKGVIPWWNPFSQTGTPFYQYYQTLGLLDPSIFLLILIKKITSCTTFTLYIIHYFFRYFILISGTYYLLLLITNDKKISFFFSLGLLLASFPVVMHQNGTINSFFLIPFITYFILKFVQATNKKKGFYLFIAMTLMSFSLNIYLPSGSIFYCLIFIILIFFLKIAKIKDNLKFLFSKNGLIWIGISIIVFFLIALPVISLSFENEELFPTVRILQPYADKLSTLFASDLNVNFLSEIFNKHYKISITLGNIFGLLSEPIRFNNLGEYSEVILYIGILPLLCILLGLISKRNKYSYLFFIIAILVLFISTGFKNEFCAKASLNQKIITSIFFFLKPIKVFQNFGLLIMFCLVIAAAIYFKKMSEKQIKNSIFIVFFIIFLKYIYNLFYTNIFMLLSALIAGLFFLFILIKKKGRFIKNRNYNLLQNIAIIILMFDLLNFCLSYISNVSNFFSNNLKSQKIYRSKLEENNFINFRDIISYDKNGMYGNSFFGHEIYKNKKSAFPNVIGKLFVSYSIPSWDHFYMTKNYYDYVTHVKLEKQVITSGISYPIVRFFKKDKIVWAKDKYDVINKINKTSITDLSKIIFLEKNINKHKTDPKGTDFFNPKYYLSFSEKEINNFKKNALEKNDNHKKLIKIKDFNVNKLIVELNTPKDGYFYYGDGYSKYWKAYVDNKKVKIEKANINFKAVYVSKGKHNITFIFDPMIFRYSFYLWFLGNLLFLGVIVYFVKNKKNRTVLTE